jgi:hypothetical protein
MTSAKISAVATGGLLSVRLGQIRRRLRLLAMLEGGVAGAALAMLAVAVAIVIARGRGGAPAALPAVASILLGAIGGALARGARRISLVRCARLADAALDGQDRLLSALALTSEDPSRGDSASPGASPGDSSFVRALVADAVRRAEALVPRAAVPARRPVGLPALGIGALALLGAALFPPSSRAARIPSPALAPVRARPLPAGALDAEREVARAAAAQAAQLGDARLAALAADYDRVLRRLAAGTLDDGAALDLLRNIEARARAAAEAAGRDARASEAAARALAANAETRAAGEALGRQGASQDELGAALGASAADHPTETARALAAAAGNLASGESGGQHGDDARADGPRRLARPEQAAANGEGASDGEKSASQDRHLEQLRRDLDDAAAACRDGDPSCRARAEARGRELARVGRQGAARDGLERLERSAGELRERARRGELRDGENQAMQSFGRAARGGGERSADRSGAREGRSANSQGANDQGANGQGANGQGASGQANDQTGDGAGSEPGTESGTGSGSPGDQSAEGAEGAAAAALAAEGGGSDEAGGGGNGIGHQPGGAPLGARPTGAAGPRGGEAEVPVADGAGPSRAEVIGTAAGRGFASRPYARMFTDYAAAVEDALAATAVPDGKRHLVRRYFDLIRPRATAPTSRRAP